MTPKWNGCPVECACLALVRQAPSADPTHFAILRSRSAAALNVHPRTPRAAASLGPRLARHLARHSAVTREPSTILVGVALAAFVARAPNTCSSVLSGRSGCSARAETPEDGHGTPAFEPGNIGIGPGVPGGMQRGEARQAR